MWFRAFGVRQPSAAFSDERDSAGDNNQDQEHDQEQESCWRLIALLNLETRVACDRSDARSWRRRLLSKLTVPHAGRLASPQAFDPQAFAHLECAQLAFLG